MTEIIRQVPYVTPPFECALDIADRDGSDVAGIILSCFKCKLFNECYPTHIAVDPEGISIILAGDCIQQQAALDFE